MLCIRDMSVLYNKKWGRELKFQCRNFTYFYNNDNNNVREENVELKILF